MEDMNAVALSLGQKLLERSTITASEVATMVMNARRAVAATRLTTRLHLLATKTAWPGLESRESIRAVLSEMDAIELGQDVPDPTVVIPERKNPEHERETAQRKTSPQAGQPRAENGPHGVKPAVPAHGHPAASTWTGKSAGNGGPTAVGKSGSGQPSGG